MNRFSIEQEKLNEVIEAVWATVPQFTKTKIEGFIDADWPNADEHQEWLNEAPVSEIADWVVSGLE